MNRSVLSFQNVSFTYKNGDQAILKSLNLDVKEGEFVSIVGASGSGKSTLFRLITGLEQQSEGDIVINGKSYEKRLGKVGYMPQQDLLLPWRTILDNAALPLELHNVSKASAHKQVSQLLEEFGLKGMKTVFQVIYPEG